MKIILTSQLLLVVGFLNAQTNQPTQNQAEISRKKERADALEVLGWKMAEQKNDSCLAVLKESIELSASANYQMGIANANIALGVFYRNQDNFEQAQNHFFKALAIYEKENDRSKMAICYNNIGNLYSSSANFSKALFYYEKAMDIYFQLKQYLQYSQTCNNIGSIFLHEENNYKSALKYYDKGLKYSDATLDPENYSILLLGKGGALFMLNHVDSAKYYYNQALFYYKKNNLTKGLCAAYFDIGYAYEMTGSLKESLHYYHQSLQLAKKSNLYSFMQKPLEGLMLVHNQLMNEDSVEHYYYELAEINALLFKEKTAKNIHDVETKYQTEKKEQALSLEKERREKSEQINQANRQTITFLSVAVALALVLILGVWGFQNQKQQIIQLKLQQQNDEIERLIHDQQVKSYESQLEGEAQERKRIASELHDRVGGLLATLNLHFEVLTEKKSLLEDGLQIQQLIKASIDEVRTISHNLHGLGQSKGLFNSLEQLKNGISSSGKLEMNLFYEIEDVNVPENVSAELYKIVQELSTNTLKHAKAKKITVQLSVIENMLHLIYEDNGSGFDVATSKKGLGIINVAERVDRCNGTWHIDSSIGRGTTVIINIPLE